MCGAFVLLAVAVAVHPQSFRGGWGLDAGSTEVIGSPYLIAHGMGRCVPDAEAEVEVPEAGVKRVWVRTRNWAEGAPGTFRVVVDGRELDHVFGRGSSEWGWEKGDTVELSGGAHRIALRDLTGFDGRCAGVVLQPDGGEPPQGALDLRGEAPQVTRTYDFVVVGGGMPGCCAAVAAARAGLRTALVQDRPVFGGNASSEIRVWCGGEMRHPLVEELRGLFMNRDANAALSDAERLARLQREPNLEVFPSHRAFAVEKDGAGIAAVKALDLSANRVVRFRGRLFCDATGDGWVGFWAGADCRYGRESKAETGEPTAADKADRMVMGASLMWQSSFANDDVPFSAPWAERFAEGGAAVNGEWFWEYGHRRDMIAEEEQIRDRLLLAIYGAFSLAKKNPSNARRMLTTLPYVLGKRESRRILGDWIITEKDMAAQRPFEDAIASVTWSVDLHFPDEKVPYISHNTHRQYGRRWIPYRAIYSRNVPNLFLAGRCISCSHAGLGAIRVMNTLSQAGVAAGTAAAMCRELGCLPREIWTKGHCRDLQRRLGGDWPGNPDPAYANWIYFDDEDKGTEFRGDWEAYTYENGGYFGNGSHHAVAKKDVAAVYKVPEVKPGRYRLYGRVPYTWHYSDCVEAVLVKVSSAAGERMFLWLQPIRCGRWNALGEIEIGTGATLTLEPAVRKREIVADGFALEPLGRSVSP